MDESTMTLADYYSAIKAEHDSNNAWSAEQAQKAMDYQTEMSNTAHQREVADLKAAGLNPVLSAGGSGATTGTGVAAQRGDQNVTALYGLMKEAMKTTMTQANAMQNTAKYIAGAAGSSNPVGIGKDSKEGKNRDTEASAEEKPWFMQLYEDGRKQANAIAAGALSRIFGGSQQKWEDALNWKDEKLDQGAKWIGENYRSVIGSFANAQQAGVGWNNPVSKSNNNTAKEISKGIENFNTSKAKNVIEKLKKLLT